MTKVKMLCAEHEQSALSQAIASAANGSEVKIYAQGEDRYGYPIKWVDVDMTPSDLSDALNQKPCMEAYVVNKGDIAYPCGNIVVTPEHVVATVLSAEAA